MNAGFETLWGVKMSAWGTKTLSKGVEALCRSEQVSVSRSQATDPSARVWGAKISVLAVNRWFVGGAPSL